MITKDLFKYFRFDLDEEMKEAEFYIGVKGAAIHQKILIHLGIDFSQEGQTIAWSKVSALLRYDKKLRDKIYIYLATLEEYLRAYISNKYECIPDQSFWQDGRTDRSKVKTRIGDGEKVSDVLESIEFGDLMNQVKNLPSNDISVMFDYTIEIKSNLDAVRILRNAVSHHSFLMGYKFRPCTVDGKKNDSLEHNIKNLRQLLPKEYRYGRNEKGGITAEIENCKFEVKQDNNNDHTRQIMDLSNKDIIKMI